jgi:hypothetical protein
MASILYLALDASNDPNFNVNDELSGTYAVAQAVLTTLKLFYGEWWEDLNLGLPVFQSILGQLGTSSGLAAMQLAIQQQILTVPYVTGVSNISVLFSGGRLTFTATVQTTFGATTVSNLPGTSASLGS